MQDDQRFMHHALGLARRQLGVTWPNPAVGAVIVKDGVIVGRGNTARGGRPHAETQAIAQAGEHTKGATLYVTLEPCAHHGKTPPCAEAVAIAGIRRVVIACSDPNPLVAGRGIEILKNAGIDVVTGVCEAEALELNRGFFSQITTGVPFVALKVATSTDGHVATAQGESKWITGETARRYGHMLRAQHDAILTGIGTVNADDPLLTCRIEGLEERSPVRVVIDTNLSIMETSQLVKTAKKTPTWVLTAESKSEKAAAVKDEGVKLLTCEKSNGRLDLNDALKQLGKRGITRLLVEAGGTLSGAFLQTSLVNRIYWFRAPLIIGSDGKAAVKAAFATALAERTRYKQLSSRQLGNDTLDVLEA